MQAGQTLVASDGYEVALFPLVALYDYQDELVGTHADTYNMDFHAYRWNGSNWVRQNNGPLYAPFTCKLVYAYPSGTSGGHGRIFQSTNLVHTPSGLRYVMFMVGHDPNPPYSTVGQVISQGTLIYHTGTYGIATGDHVHMGCGSGTWQGWNTSMTTRPSGHQDFTNHIHIYDTFYVNDTTILQGQGHNWQTWTQPIPPTPTGETKFPWYIYFRKRRNLWK